MCDMTTEWGFGFTEEDDSEEFLAAQDSREGETPSEAAEKRRAKRLTDKLPIRIRLPDGREEITRTENLSKTGVCFMSSEEMRVGDSINLLVGCEPGTNETEFTDRVVRRRPLEGRREAIYGAHLEKP